jgi:hypothetical protein
MRLSLAALLVVPCAGTCLDDGILSAQRRNLSAGTQSMPLGIVVPTWDSAAVASYVFKILAEEVLGYNVELLEGIGSGPRIVDILANCDTLDHCLEQRAEGTADSAVGQWHLFFEVWPAPSNQRDQYDQMLPERAPVDLGSIGYVGREGPYISQEVLNDTLASKIPADYYRGFSADWYQTWNYFDRFEDISPDLLEDCSAFTNDAPGKLRFPTYNTHFPEDGSVTCSEDGSCTVQCWSQKWWLSPACREKNETCIPYLDKPGWGARSMTQIANAYNMPIAIALAKGGDEWLSIVRDHKVLTFWWEPDAMFVAYHLTRVVLPEYNAEEWSRALWTSAVPDTQLKKMAASGLDSIAGDAYSVASQMSMELSEMSSALMEFVSTEGATHDSVACSWLRASQAKWGAWLPDPTSCAEGQGLVGSDGAFLGSPENATGCSWCDPGSHSVFYGTTLDRICSTCPPGTFQNQPGKAVCKDCGEGYFTAERGRSSCNTCALGTYAAGTGNTECSECSKEHEVTPFRAAVSPWECTCAEGFFRLAGHSEQTETHRQCAACPEGMSCAGGEAEPMLLEGFWASLEDSGDRDYSVFHCRDEFECPGGLAGTCAPGREGISCANCKSDHKAGDLGECKPCSEQSAFVYLIPLAILFVGLATLVGYATVDVSKTNINALQVAICAGQSLVTLQALSVFGALRVHWVDPYASLLQVVSTLSLGIDTYETSCMFPESYVVAKFAFVMLTFPAGVLILCALLFGIKLARLRRVSADTVINQVGMLILTFFLTLLTTSLAPFHCIGSPNGTSSLHTNPSVVCFDTSEWVSLCVFGVIGTLVYGVGFLSWAAFVIRRYPKLVASDQGMTVISRYRFMFQRFRPQHYYFTLAYLARNVLFAMVPIFFADYGHRQIVLLSCVLLVYGLAQTRLQPWRGLGPNLLDTVTVGLLLLALCAGGLLVQVDHNVVAEDLQVFFSVILVLMVGIVIGTVGYFVWRVKVPRNAFAAFLCHHKVGCGAGARLMKMELEARLQAPVFLDSDSLDDLEDLLNIVRTSVKNLVVLLTKDVLSRPWCAGEIACAFACQVKMIPVRFDDFVELTDECLTEDALEARWSAEQFAPCVLQGVTVPSVLQAYAYLSTLDTIPCYRVAECFSDNMLASTEAADSVAGACSGVSNTHMSSGSTSNSEAAGSSNNKLAVVGNSCDGEAISTVLLLCSMVRKQTQWETIEVTHPRHVAKACEVQPRFLVVILTEGCLTSAHFMDSVNAAVQAWTSAELMTMKMATFIFPDTKAVQQQLAPQMAKVVSNGSKEEPEVCTMYQKLLGIISLPFSPCGSLSVLEVEVQEFLRRAKRRETQHLASAERSTPIASTSFRPPRA